MTLLPTRVDDKTARQFEKVARERGETTYSYLQRVVKQAASAAEPDGWDKHWDKMKTFNLKPATKTLAELREMSRER